METPPMSLADGEGPRILFIDCFDSFTNNIIGLLEEQINAVVTMVHIDDKAVDSNLEDILTQFDGVVIGPGPGHPSNPKDIGFIPKLWKLSTEHLLPIFGICLGFQSLCFTHGAEIRRLSKPRHGIVSTAEHQATDIFAGIGTLEATQYHSLCADLRLDQAEEATTPSLSWSPSPKCPTLQPLAWDLTDNSNGPILMGVRHTEKPFWGVQFHPESICTSPAGKQLLANWWKHAQIWIEDHQQHCGRSMEHDANHLSIDEKLNTENTTPSVPKEVNFFAAAAAPPSHLAQTLRASLGSDDVHLRWGKHNIASMNGPELIEALGHERDEVILLDSQGHFSGRYTIIGLVVPGQTMRVTYQVRDKLLRYGVGEGHMYSNQLNSIEEVWPMLQEALDLHNPHNTHGRTSRASTPGCENTLSGMDRFNAGQLPEESPFWGGFVGYFSYEAGLETVDVELTEETSKGDVPDINLAFIHRSIVIDHETSQVYIQSLLPGDWTWILTVGRTLAEEASRSEIRRQRYPMTPDMTPAGSPGLESPLKEGSRLLASSKDMLEKKILDTVLSNAEVSRPEETKYRQNVLRTQEFLSSGDSYELCLTDRTEIKVPVRQAAGGFGTEGGVSPWALYKRLRANNPAPFGAFMKLSGSVVVGSSPERFLRWTRDGACQFRPIKGTVKKGGDMTREKAHEILNSSKERAENLMIVDLIRHDLSGVIGAANTWVSKLMVVEEYEKVYQLVSVIEGQLPRPTMVSTAPPNSALDIGAALRSSSSDDGSSVADNTTNNGAGIAPSSSQAVTGMHILKASLPPGSMTGAPKKRSCEILQQIEKKPRGIYSGVLGYMDIGGAGDFSVVIRTAVKAGEASSSSSPFSQTTRRSETVHGLGVSCTPSPAAAVEGSLPASGAVGSGVNSSYFPGQAVALGAISGSPRSELAGITWIETWRVGAGGAVTIQSTDEGEFLEMETKAGSVLGALFGGE